MMKKIEQVNTLILRGGLLVAMGLLIVGCLIAALDGGASVSGSASLKELPRALADLQAGGFFSLGLFLLILVPGARVAGLLVEFAGRREWLFAGLSLTVLVLLALGVFLGLDA